jgi:hypothetical protein
MGTPPRPAPAPGIPASDGRGAPPLGTADNPAPVNGRDNPGPPDGSELPARDPVSGDNDGADPADGGRSALFPAPAPGNVLNDPG